MAITMKTAPAMRYQSLASMRERPAIRVAASRTALKSTRGTSSTSRHRAPVCYDLLRLVTPTFKKFGSALPQYRWPAERACNRATSLALPALPGEFEDLVRE